jgi:multicomponent Na+:H+ antiporter subunit D
MARVLDEGPIAAQMGNWPAPFGITLVADILSAAMVLITGIIAVACAVYGLADVTRNEERHGHHALTMRCSPASAGPSSPATSSTSTSGSR